MKIIVAFCGIIFLWGIAPVFASGCVPGTYVSGSGGLCVTCPFGYYSDTVDATECTECPAPYTETWGGAADINLVGNHDKKTDCIIRVIFHGNGGKFPHYTNNTVVPTEDITVGANFTTPTNVYHATCPVAIKTASGPQTINLCGSNKDNFKISHPTETNVWKRSGYEFAGWYRDSVDFGTLVSESDTFTTSMDLYAKWCKYAGEEDGNWTAKDGNCVCKKGYVLFGGKCTKCPLNQTTAEAGADQCFCEKGFQPTELLNICEKCPDGYTTYETNGACKPIKEFRYSGGIWTWPDAVEPIETHIQ